jgi:hypothetical protein
MRSGPVTHTSVIGTAVASVILGTVFGIAAVHSHREASALNDHGLVTEAEVIAIDADYVRVVFATSDRGRVETEFSDFRVDPRPEPGATMQVRYDPADPYRHIQDARLAPDFVGAWLLAASSLAIAVFGLYLAYIFWPLIGTRWP